MSDINSPVENLDHLNHWRLVQAMRDRFWVQWSKEYLKTLQQRTKWNKPSKNIQIGEFVSIIDASLLNDGHWPMGRITEVFPGQDGLVRAVKVHTSKGDYVRPVVKISRLPVN